MEQIQLFADNPDCRKCAAKAPLNRPWYTFHEKWYTDECFDYHCEHIHLCCRRCGYRWIMSPMDADRATGGTRGDHGLRPGSIHKVEAKWYDKSPLGRLVVPGMPSYQQNTERFNELDKSQSRKIGWRKKIERVTD